KLSPDEVRRVVAHIWELGTTHFDYFYLTENCSYHMLSLLEAGAPRLKLLSKLPRWTLPTDTLKVLFESDLVSETHLRPSLDTQFRTRVGMLSRGEVAELETLTRASKTSAQITAPSIKNEKVFDAFIDYVDLLFAQKLLEKETEAVQAKQNLLVQRSRLPIAESLDFSKLRLISPHLSHGSSRASIARVRDEDHALTGDATELGFRFAFHDLLDPAMGLPDFSEVQFVDFKVRYWEDIKKFRLENFTLIGVGNYSPVDAFHKDASWKVRFGLKRFSDRRCEPSGHNNDCLGGAVELGYGYSFQPLNAVLAYALIEGNLDTSAGFLQDKLVPRLGPTLGARTRFTPSLAALLEAKTQTSLVHPSFTEKSLEARLRWVPKSWGLDLRALWTTDHQELTTSALLYF
ncbi:MAG: DUF4105 domain-containing protein, partial [Proteobacteria bacterium]